MARLLRTAALFAAAAWFTLAHVGQLYRIQGSSMTPALAPGERVLVSKLNARFSLVGRGDVVVFRDPLDAGTVMVKRVVGIPGDTVRFLADQVEVVPGPGSGGSLGRAVAPVANAAGSEPLAAGGERPVGLESPGAVSLVLGEADYFVLGDNRAGSSDSRHWGAIRRDAILGEAVLRVFPWRRFGAVAP